MKTSIAGIALLALSFATNAQSVVSSTFDAGAEGWTANADFKDFTWLPTGGNPGGHISAADKSQGLDWYFVAPSAFLGNKSAFANGTLSFDLKQLATSNQYDTSDIILIGNGVTLTYDTASNPGTNWTSYSVILAPTGWKKGAAAANSSDFATVLANLTSLQIRGEYRSGADTGYLDNVVMTAAVPEPETYAMLLAGLGLMGSMVRRRKR